MLQNSFEFDFVVGNNIEHEKQANVRLNGSGATKSGWHTVVINLDEN